jgi:hypothetical protein
MEIKKGGVISFRLPNDTTDEFLEYLNNLKSSSGRTFSSRILQIFLKGLANEAKLGKDDYIFLKVPREISIEKRKWLQSKETQQYLISLYTQPIFSMSEPSAVTENNTLSETNKIISSKTETFIFDNFIDLDD